MVTFDGQEMGSETIPMTYDEDRREFSFQTDDFYYVKTFEKKKYSYTIYAYLEEYPDV